MQQVRVPHVDCPGISVEMYNLAISLIQSFDEMEGKESRWGLSIRAHPTSLKQTLMSLSRLRLFKQQCQQRRELDF